LFATREIEDRQIQAARSLPETQIPSLVSGDFFTDPIPGLDTPLNLLIISTSGSTPAQKEQTGLKL
jgi:hypothetical protein